MPRGGLRPGAGRKRGTLNPKTLEALARIGAMPPPLPSQSIVAQPPRETPQRKRARERLEEMMEICVGAAAYYQPSGLRRGEVNANENWEEFKSWTRIAIECMTRLAPYQDPRFLAVAVATTPNPAVPEGEARDNVLQINDPAAAARVYLRVVKGDAA